jgi:hypothetical protein
MTTREPCRIFSCNFIKLIGLLLFFTLIDSRADTTDEELEALDRQIQRLETEQAAAERQAAVDAEVKRREEDRIRAETEARNVAELERKKREEEIAKAEREKLDMYNRHFELAGNYLNEDKFDLAISEYQKLLAAFPDDPQTLDGIRTAQKFLNACTEFVGRWFVEPNGIRWEARQDGTIHGKWLVFSSDGFWECASARDREFVTSWPDCPVCNTDYFILSDDSKTLTGIRNSTALKGRRMPDPR